MPPVVFEPTISAGERPQTHALDRAATGIGSDLTYTAKYYWTTLNMLYSAICVKPNLKNFNKIWYLRNWFEMFNTIHILCNRLIIQYSNLKVENRPCVNTFDGDRKHVG